MFSNADTLHEIHKVMRVKRLSLLYIKARGTQQVRMLLFKTKSQQERGILQQKHHKQINASD